MVRKLCFLQQSRVVNIDPEILSGHVMLACTLWDVDALCFVKKCREREQCFGLNFTDGILRRIACSIKEMKKMNYNQDRTMCIDKCLQKAPFIAEVAMQVGWP